MASGMSPPGRPGFKIRPLRLDEEIPSGRRDTWLSKHDRKHHFHYFKPKIKYKMYNIYIYLTNMQNHKICVYNLYKNCILGIEQCGLNAPH